MELLIVEYDNLDMEPDTTTTLDGKRFSGLAYEILGNGNIANDFFFDGIMWGPSRIWAPSGQLIEEWWHFGVDSFHGVNQTWSLEGKLETKEEFWKGVRVGFEEWDGNGNLINAEKIAISELMRIGYSEGVWKEYYQNAGKPTELWQMYENEYGGKYFP